MDRRSVLALPIAALIGGTAARASTPSAFPLSFDLLQPDLSARTTLPIAVVSSGDDREGHKHQIGVSATTYKVGTSDIKGDLFVIEQANQRRGGPPLHVHQGEDALFYVLEGEYLVQVGDRRFSPEDRRLRSGATRRAACLGLCRIDDGSPTPELRARR